MLFFITFEIERQPESDSIHNLDLTKKTRPITTDHNCYLICPRTLN